MKELKDIKMVFFGTGPLAENTLVTLIEGGVKPSFVVTKPDSKIGRGQTLTPPQIALIAKQLGIKVLQPANFNTIPKELSEEEFDIFVVASYGKMLPASILDIPLFGTINVHPSLLPKYRGPTPIESALLAREETLGVSIMFLDEEMDHGPILTQRTFNDFQELKDATTETFERLAGVYGGSLLLTEVLLPFMRGALVAEEQDHSSATYTKKFTKESGLVSLNQSMEEIMRVYRACTPWPSCYFFIENNGKKIRVKITKMNIEDSEPKIIQVVPEGKKEMLFEDFKNGYLNKK